MAAGCAMNRRSLAFAVAVLPLLVSAAPPADADPVALVRAANDALRAGDADAADRLYAAAEGRAADPGLVAFNRAAALFDRGQFRDAEVHYLRTLADAECPPDRRARAEYNRGVCLVRRGGASAVYRAAVGCFERALDPPPNDDGFAADVRYNLELAKRLWVAARAKEGKPPAPNDPPPDANEPPDRPPPKAETGRDPEPGKPGEDRNARATPNPNARPPKPDQATGARATETTEKTPGRGMLPVLVDDDRPQPLSPEDTRALLRRAADRLEAERKAAARRAVGLDRPGVKDW